MRTYLMKVGFFISDIKTPQQLNNKAVKVPPSDRVIVAMEIDPPITLANGDRYSHKAHVGGKERTLTHIVQGREYRADMDMLLLHTGNIQLPDRAAMLPFVNELADCGFERFEVEGEEDSGIILPGQG